MLFNSYEFIFLYLPIVCGLFFAIARISRHLGILWLDLASMFFYGWWNPKYVVLLLASIVANYFLGCFIARLEKKWIAWGMLTIAIALNIGLLVYFKYANFFLTTLAGTTGMAMPVADVILPLGISFFTFTQIAFLVDVYRRIVREYNFTHYLLFVSYFPHLIAGPVLHHAQLMPQFRSNSIYRPDLAGISVGISYFIVGLGKKYCWQTTFPNMLRRCLMRARRELC